MDTNMFWLVYVSIILFFFFSISTLIYLFFENRFKTKQLNFALDQIDKIEKNYDVAIDKINELVESHNNFRQEYNQDICTEKLIGDFVNESK